MPEEARTGQLMALSKSVEYGSRRSETPCRFRIGQEAHDFTGRGESLMSKPERLSTNPRRVEFHKELGGMNNDIEIWCLDEPMQPNNACHVYQIDVAGVPVCTIHFQKGPVKEYGANGLSNEALVAIAIDRLVGFQAGQFKCDSNQRQLEHLQAYLAEAKARTAGRVAAGVEGRDKEAGKG